jgi:hypothetical protein
MMAVGSTTLAFEGEISEIFDTESTTVQVSSRVFQSSNGSSGYLWHVLLTSLSDGAILTIVETGTSELPT